MRGRGTEVLGVEGQERQHDRQPEDVDDDDEEDRQQRGALHRGEALSCEPRGGAKRQGPAARQLQRLLQRKPNGPSRRSRLATIRSTCISGTQVALEDALGFSKTIESDACCAIFALASLALAARFTLLAIACGSKSGFRSRCSLISTGPALGSVTSAPAGIDHGGPSCGGEVRPRERSVIADAGRERQARPSPGGRGGGCTGTATCTRQQGG